MPILPIIFVASSISAIVADLVAKHSRDPDVRRKAEIVRDVSKVLSAILIIVSPLKVPKVPIRRLPL